MAKWQMQYTARHITSDHGMRHTHDVQNLGRRRLHIAAISGCSAFPSSFLSASQALHAQSSPSSNMTLHSTNALQEARTARRLGNFAGAASCRGYSTGILTLDLADQDNVTACAL